VTSTGDGLPQRRDRSMSGGPDLFTLRAWLRAERAVEEGQPLDDTVAFMQDRVAAIFGPQVFSRFSEFLAQQRLTDLGTLVDDEPRLRALLSSLVAGDGEPEDEEEFEWRATEPGDGLHRFRRARRNRRRTAALALVLPRARRVAGPRR